MFLAGARAAVRMFRSGETSETMESMLAPVAGLEALKKSMATSARVKVIL